MLVGLSEKKLFQNHIPASDFRCKYDSFYTGIYHVLVCEGLISFQDFQLHPAKKCQDIGVYALISQAAVRFLQLASLATSNKQQTGLRNWSNQ